MMYYIIYPNYNALKYNDNYVSTNKKTVCNQIIEIVKRQNAENARAIYYVDSFSYSLKEKIMVHYWNNGEKKPFRQGYLFDQVILGKKIAIVEHEKSSFKVYLVLNDLSDVDVDPKRALLILRRLLTEQTVQRVYIANYSLTHFMESSDPAFDDSVYNDIKNYVGKMYAPISDKPYHPPMAIEMHDLLMHFLTREPPMCNTDLCKMFNMKKNALSQFMVKNIVDRKPYNKGKRMTLEDTDQYVRVRNSVLEQALQSINMIPDRK